MIVGQGNLGSLFGLSTLSAGSEVVRFVVVHGFAGYSADADAEEYLCCSNLVPGFLVELVMKNPRCWPLCRCVFLGK